jgi:NodT family efflux transporter outer membrane factor (OMF) lipoprotein
MICPLFGGVPPFVRLTFHSGRAVFAVILCLAPLFLIRCSVGSKYVRPSVAVPSTYRENQPGSELARKGGWKQADPKDAMLRGEWWEIFGDEELNSLEEKLVIDNQNIKQYFENYMAARALARNARASLFPGVAASPSATKQGSGSKAYESSGAGWTYELPFTASWEPDLFGSIRNTVLSDVNAAQASAANLANETLSEQASLAQYYFELRGQDALQEIYDATAASYRRTLDLTQALAETGIDSPQDVASAEVNLRTAEANAVAVGTTRAQYEHAIALLIGQPAADFSLPAKPLDAIPPPVPAGIPSQLLERRPDIAAAERTVAQANALIGVQRAAYFPTITLTGNGGFQSTTIADLTSWPAYFWSLSASATQTLLDFSARQENVRRYQALYDADVASYRQTVLNAVKEVEDYLVAARRLAEQTERQRLAVDAARRYEEIARTRYETGMDTYLNVLTAQTSLLANRLTLVNIETNRMVAAVQLIAALGGGWESGDSAGLPAAGGEKKK